MKKNIVVEDLDEKNSNQYKIKINDQEEDCFEENEDSAIQNRLKETVQTDLYKRKSNRELTKGEAPEVRIKSREVSVVKIRGKM